MAINATFRAILMVQVIGLNQMLAHEVVDNNGMDIMKRFADLKPQGVVDLIKLVRHTIVPQIGPIPDRKMLFPVTSDHNT